MWRVVELEEKDDRFTVSVVVGNWVVKINDLIYCYWPEKDAARKIKIAVDPNSGGKWSLYKCRLLMDGATFGSYREAKESEKICEDVSTMSAYIHKTKRRRENVKVKDESKKKKSTHDQSDLYQHFGKLQPKNDVEISDNSSEDDDNCFTGNDSFEFNKALLKGGHYCTNAETTSDQSSQFIDVEKLDSLQQTNINEDIDASYTQTNESEIFSVDDDYDDFKSNAADLLTSSVISEYKSKLISETDNKHSCAPNNASKMPNDVLARIKKIESTVLEFTCNVQSELNELKKILGSDCIVEGLTNSGEHQLTVCKQYKVSSPVEGNVLINNEIESGNNEKLHLPVIEHSKTMSSDVLAENGNFPISDAIKILFALSNENYNQNEVHIDDVHDAPRIGESIDIPIDATFKVTPILPLEKSTVDDEMDFPIVDGSHYDIVEKSLGSQRNANTLKELTVPEDKETESKYMDRIFLKLFEKQFFLDKISWRKEKNRIDMRGSSILKYWKESHRTKFMEGIGDSNFVIHCRRLKSAIRARDKQKDKQKDDDEPTINK